MPKKEPVESDDFSEVQNIYKGEFKEFLESDDDQTNKITKLIEEANNSHVDLHWCLLQALEYKNSSAMVKAILKQKHLKEEYIPKAFCISFGQESYEYSAMILPSLMKIASCQENLKTLITECKSETALQDTSEIHGCIGELLLIAIAYKDAHALVEALLEQKCIKEEYISQAWDYIIEADDTEYLGIMLSCTKTKTALNLLGRAINEEEEEVSDVFQHLLEHINLKYINKKDKKTIKKELPKIFTQELQENQIQYYKAIEQYPDLTTHEASGVTNQDNTGPAFKFRPSGLSQVVQGLLK